MVSSQQFIPIADIDQDLIFLKDGSVTLVLNTSAVNFGLLFETEQIAIIDSFAGLLNSLSFPIQIVIRSRSLDVSSYLHTLDQAFNQQQNPLLKNMILGYRKFVESIIKENDVLDKQFYVCISVTAAELGILPKQTQDKIKKALTILSPRKDHLVRQLSRLGLKATQVKTTELVKIFYDIYNPEQQVAPTQAVGVPVQPVQVPQAVAPQIPVAPTQQPTQPRPAIRRFPNPVPIMPQASNQPIRPPAAQPTTAYSPVVSNLTPPFVVEELPDDYGS